MISLTYTLEVREEIKKKFEKIRKRDPAQEQAIKKKIAQILENPERFKPLHAPMQNKRRVHVWGSFVLIYSFKKAENIVIIEEYEHHDAIYR